MAVFRVQCFSKQVLMFDNRCYSNHKSFGRKVKRNERFRNSASEKRQMIYEVRKFIEMKELDTFSSEFCSVYSLEK